MTTTAIRWEELPTWMFRTLLGLMTTMDGLSDHDIVVVFRTLRADDDRPQ
ncbi:hypothetical protein QQY66_48260 [Streptomyces sp. DG2A-72]|nr:hypothetical protein [Streptomyces sp. DG2A-72]MDO0939126.1 hypothetical protein [Streptomyces sp. DG2A-72]